MQDIDVFAIKTRVSFVDHIAEVLQPLICGAPMALIPDADDPQAMLEIIDCHRVTRITLVPSQLKALLQPQSSRAG